ncbi:peptidoglycan DD-metalloendopeptidase family protein [Mesonia maritima]|uniref:Murein DD-endopeptidase MepM/ murein hydrolase activator NlpD n=1 Tax=Mesonia maritima TaxID=1793873 RepID=A0ABU1K4F5_9FLAO|nr:peptidoglycan DD-metalloendopeptidase family protein [Mesonia maritima]MDR6300499.1 murein DD-endopeptidase MepM/ murein hydrolase activator NlpD [Mesonia maritima]
MNLSEKIKSLTSDFTPVIDSSIPQEEYVKIDLSEENEVLQKIDITSAVIFQNYITEFLKKKNAKVAYGGYLEKRALYKRSSYFLAEENPNKERNIHIGLDIWAPAKTEIIAPLEGKIHSFKNNQNFGDYGPTIILEHQVESFKFYTLYGHLSLNSIENCKVGKSIKQGERFAELGDSSVNGDYAPHLHFQLILKIEDFKGDYPGVSSAEKLDFYKENCPDPNLLLKID